MTIGVPRGAPGVSEASAPSPKTETRLVNRRGSVGCSMGASAAAIMTGTASWTVVVADSVWTVFCTTVSAGSAAATTFAARPSTLRMSTVGLAAARRRTSLSTGLLTGAADDFFSTGSGFAGSTTSVSSGSASSTSSTSAAPAFFCDVTFLLVRAPPVVTAIPRSAARVKDDSRELALDVSAVNDGVWVSRAASGAGEGSGVVASSASGASPGSRPTSPSADGGGSVVDGSDPVGPAHATPCPVATAAPIPRATANPPTRPI